MSINIDDFKKSLAHYASGVTVVTTRYEGKPIGITATSFSSLSLEPPLVLVSLSKKLFTHHVVCDSGIFAVNVLGVHQYEVGLRFAGMIPDIEDRFAGLAVETAVTGCPLLYHSLAWFDCRVWASYEGGDHTIFVGEVVEVSTCAHETGTPLLYHSRNWWCSQVLDVALPFNNS